MSTLRVDAVSNTGATKSANTADLVDGRCTAWVNLDGTGTIAITDSFNVSSVTDLGVGDYKLQFTTSMANNKYVMAGSAQDMATATTDMIQVQEPPNSAGVKSVERFEVSVAYNNSTTDRTLIDVSAVHVAVFGGR